MVPALTVTKKDQSTLHKDVLQHRGVSPGDRLELEMPPSGRVGMGAAPKQGIEGFFGCLQSPLDQAPSIEELDTAIQAAWVGRR